MQAQQQVQMPMPMQMQMPQMQMPQLNSPPSFNFVASNPPPLTPPTVGTTESAKEGAPVAIDLPCSVHTFGFGSDHDTNMLKAIADTGSGTYFFLKDKDDIPDAFADCLGGLLSVVGQNIQLKFQSRNGVVITKILTKFKTVVDVGTGVHTVTIGDIQSEEERDVLVTLDLPDGGELEQQEVIEAVLSYFNVITSRQEELKTIIRVMRPATVDDGTNKVNFKLDLQRNRISTANAIEAAKKLGDEGKLEEARKTINAAMEKLRASLSKDDKFTQGLLRDLEKTLEGLQDRQSYSSYGQQQMNAAAGMHWNQRAAQKAWSPSYETSSRSAQKANFSKQ